MNCISSARGALLLACATLPIPAPADAAPKTLAASAGDALKELEVDIPSSRFTLQNGLTVVVHEDHSAPLIAVNIWYHVGSKNEPSGKSGFAHLFEHLMFNGSEHFNDDFFKATEKLGATDQNGTTNVDRTNYFQTVPKSALDPMLWLESDRMGHLLGAIDQAKLDEQRAVVKNEKRQGDNRPYSKAQDLIIRATEPAGHPYDHSTIGSMADLDAASLDDVKGWFRTFYGPSNAVLVLAGDITPAEAKEKALKYFGDIPPGTPVSQPQSWAMPLPAPIRETAYDRVAAPRLYRIWNIGAYRDADSDYLQLLGQVLAGDKNARLYRRLVLGEQLATEVTAETDGREIGGQFEIVVTAKPGGDLDRITAIVDEELANLLASGPTPSELARIRTTNLAAYVRALESISTKASILAESQVYLGDANGWKASFERLRDATPLDLKNAGKRWLTLPDYALRVEPFGDLNASTSGADRSAMPTPSAPVPAHFPEVEQATLANGLKLMVARRPGAPIVNATMLFNTGIAPDFAAQSPALGTVTMNLLDEATTHRTSEQLVADLAALGASLQSGGGAENGSVTLSALTPTLRPALTLFADVILHPALAGSDLERIKSQTIASVASQRQDPGQIAGRVFPKLLFGADHPYGRVTTAASIAPIGRADVAAFHKRWFVPANATLIVTGDTGLAAIRPMIEQAFAGWSGGTATEPLIPVAANPSQSVIYLVDKPGAAQSVIRVGVVAPPRKAGDEIAREALNTALGGAFTSRLNMKLREEKGWAYGAGSRLAGGRGARQFFANASVQADKTADSMREIANSFEALTTTKPVDPAELAAAKDNMLLGLSSEWSTGAGIAQYLVDEAVNSLPADYYARFPAETAAKSLGDVNGAAAELLANRPLTWVVVGDRSKIEASVRALGLGEVRIVDADGNPVP